MEALRSFKVLHSTDLATLRLISDQAYFQIGYSLNSHNLYY